MHKTRLIALIAVTAIVLLAISGTVSAMDFTKSVNDAVNDVTNPDVDIIKVSSRKLGDEVVFSMEVSGEIKDNDEFNEYGYWIYITEMKSENQNIWISYSDGEANWVDYSGQAMNAGISNFEISGNTLDISIPESAFSDMDDFYFWAYCVYSNSQTSGGSVDYLYSWSDTSSGAGGGSGGGSEGETSGEDIAQNILAGGMVILALAIIVPVVLILVIVVVLLKVMKSDEESEQGYERQYNPPPKREKEPAMQVDQDREISEEDQIDR